MGNKINHINDNVTKEITYVLINKSVAMRQDGSGLLITNDQIETIAKAADVQMREHFPIHWPHLPPARVIFSADETVLINEPLLIPVYFYDANPLFQDTTQYSGVHGCSNPTAPPGAALATDTFPTETYPVSGRPHAIVLTRTPNGSGGYIDFPVFQHILDPSNIGIGRRSAMSMIVSHEIVEIHADTIRQGGTDFNNVFVRLHLPCAFGVSGSQLIVTSDGSPFALRALNFETADPAFVDGYNIRVNGVDVLMSNFVTPAWFDGANLLSSRSYPGTTPVPSGTLFDYLGVLGGAWLLDANNFAGPQFIGGYTFFILTPTSVQAPPITGTVNPAFQEVEDFFNLNPRCSLPVVNLSGNVRIPVGFEFLTAIQLVGTEGDDIDRSWRFNRLGKTLDLDNLITPPSSSLFKRACRIVIPD